MSLLDQQAMLQTQPPKGTAGIISPVVDRVATADEVKSIYNTFLKRPPTAQELGHHEVNKTGFNHLESWAQGIQAKEKAENPNSFTNILVKMLKSFQGKTSKDLEEKRKQAQANLRLLQEEKYKRAVAPWSGLKTQSPQNMAIIRQAQVDSILPSIQNAKNTITRIDDSIKFVGDLSNTIRDLKKEQQDQALRSMEMLSASGQPFERLNNSQISSLINYTGLDVQELRDYYDASLQKMSAQNKMDSVRSLKGGLYDVVSDKWIVSPTSSTTPSPSPTTTTSTIDPTTGQTIEPTGLNSIFTPETTIGDGIENAKDNGFSRSDVKTFLDLETKLTLSSIEDALDEIYEPEVDKIRPDQVRQIAEAVFKKAGNIDEAITLIEEAPTINKKALTESVRQAIIAELEVMRSEKRTFWQKVLPFGK